MTTDGEVMSTYLGWTVLVIALGLMPVTLMWLLFKPLEDFYDTDIAKDFAPFFQELSKNSKGKMSYFFVFMIRRVYFVAISIYLKQYSLQIISILISNLLVIIYIGLARPFSRILRNKIELVNECLVSTACVHLMMFTDWIPDQEKQY